MTSNVGSRRILEVCRARGPVNGLVSKPLKEKENTMAASSTPGSSPETGLDAIRSSMQESLRTDEDIDSLYFELSEVVKEELESAMKPELLNRIDEIVIFSPLSSSNLYNIAVRNVDLITKRATEEHRFSVDVDESLIRRIVEEGSANADQFGARPMRRAAQRYVEDSLSEAIIGGFLLEGSVVTLSLDDYTPRGKPSVTLECAGKLLNVEIEDDSGGIGTTSSSSNKRGVNVNGRSPFKEFETQPVR
jgi:C-terminal, D2-small domain, of ClpB protein